MSDKDHIDDDYDFARANYYNLVEKGQEGIDLMLDLARESEHPRAFEVLSTMIKNTADVSDKLMALQKQKKEVMKSEQGEQPKQLTQNNVFVGSATDLQKMLLKRQEEKVIDAEGQE
jgi:hypothetical protein